MDIISSNEYKRLIKDMLQFIHSFCVKNEIKYFISYGTLLGAVRHGGFIPWDDDIDICMPYKDYEKFVQAFCDSEQRYYLISPESDRNYYNNFARVCDGDTLLKLHGVSNIRRLGAFIDVFPLMNVPDERENREVLFKELQEVRGGILRALPFPCYLTNEKSDAVKCLISPKRYYYRYLIGLRRLKEKRDKLMRKYNEVDTSYVNILFDSPAESDTLKKSEIEDLQMIKFEDIFVYAPRNFDSVLKTWYGDYMRLPEEDKRVSIHHFVAYKK